MRPEVSIVVPSFARQDQTLRAVRSAFRQEEIDLEVVVIDDASPIPLRLPGDLAAEPRLRLIRLSQNGGPAAARNAGVAATRGEHVAFLDSDDFLLPDTLAPRLRWLTERGEGRPLLAASPVWRWRPGRDAVLSQPVPADTIDSLASGCWYFPGSTALFSRRTWERVGPLDPSLRRLEDLDWGIRLAQAGGALAVTPMPAAVIQRSRPAGREAVGSAAAAIEARFAPRAPAGLPRRPFQNLRAYLALERANAALGERAHGQFAAEMARSLLLRPRRSLHLRAWWSERPGTASELTQIGALAESLSAPADGA